MLCDAIDWLKYSNNKQVIGHIYNFILCTIVQNNKECAVLLKIQICDMHLKTL